jgi:hypothetical protein
MNLLGSIFVLGHRQIIACASLSDVLLSLCWVVKSVLSVLQCAVVPVVCELSGCCLCKAGMASSCRVHVWHAVLDAA